MERGKSWVEPSRSGQWVESTVAYDVAAIRPPKQQRLLPCGVPFCMKTVWTCAPLPDRMKLGVGRKVVPADRRPAAKQRARHQGKDDDAHRDHTSDMVTSAFSVLQLLQSQPGVLRVSPTQER